MPVWDNLSDTTARLTLDGSESGVVSREKVFTGEPNELYTFYLDADTDAIEVEPFLQVVGGDLTLVTESGGERLVARGETDGSGNLTLRMGVQSAESGPTSEGSDDLTYANQAAAEAASWVVTDTSGVGGWTFDSGHAIAGSGLATSVKLGINGLGGISTTAMRMTRVFNVGAGATVTGKMWAEGFGSRWEFLSLQIVNLAGADRISNVDGNDGVKHLDTGPLVAGGDGLITVNINMGACYNVNHVSHSYHFSGLVLEGAGGETVINFSDIGPCLGTGISETGGPEIAMAA